MSCGQQFEIAKMCCQDDRAFARIAAFHLVPIVEAVVSDPPRETPIKKTAEADIFGSTAPQVHIRRAQNAPALNLALVRKRKCQVAQANPDMTPIQQISGQTASHAELI